MHCQAIPLLEVSPEPRLPCRDQVRDQDLSIKGLRFIILEINHKQSEIYQSTSWKFDNEIRRYASGHQIYYEAVQKDLTCCMRERKSPIVPGEPSVVAGAEFLGDAAKAGGRRYLHWDGPNPFYH